MKINVRTLGQAAVSWIVYLILLMPAIQGVARWLTTESYTITLAIYLLWLLLSIVAALSLGITRLKGITGWYAIFIVLVLVSLALKNGSDTRSVIDVVFWVLVGGASIILCLAVEKKRALVFTQDKLLLYISFTGACIFAFLYSESIFGSQRIASKFDERFLDPHTIGYSNAFYAASALNYMIKERFSMHFTVACATLILGCVLILSAGSKGPIIGLGFFLLLHLYFSGVRTASVVVLLSGVSVYLSDTIIRSVGVRRMVEFDAEARATGALTRLDLWVSAAGEVAIRPFGTGSPRASSYDFTPHNLLLEAGLIAGWPAIILLSYVIIFSSRVAAVLVSKKDLLGGLYIIELVHLSVSASLIKSMVFCLLTSFILVKGKNQVRLG